MIEIENLDEVLHAMNENEASDGKEPFHIRAIPMDAPDAPSLKQMLEEVLAEVDKWENVIVLRFNVEKKHGEKCTANGDTRMAVRGPHAAIHGVEFIEQMVNALKRKIMDTFMDDLLDKHFNRKPKENL